MFEKINAELAELANKLPEGHSTKESILRDDAFEEIRDTARSDIYNRAVDGLTDADCEILEKISELADSAAD